MRRVRQLLALFFLSTWCLGCAVQAQMDFDRGLDLLNEGKYQAAEQSFTSALENAPRFAQAYLKRGEAYHRQGLYDKSLADYQKAIDLYPKSANAYYQRGQVFEEDTLNKLWRWGQFAVKFYAPQFLLASLGRDAPTPRAR